MKELYSDWLSNVIDKYITTCSECGEINVDSFLIYSGGDKNPEYICESCKLKSERDSKIEDILK